MLTADRLVAAPGATLADVDLGDFIVESLSRAGLEGSTVLLVVPDATRTMPLPLVLRAVHAALSGRVRRLTVVVALGTHRPLRDDELDVHFGVPRDGWASQFPRVNRHNHEWWREDTFVHLGQIDRATVRDLSGGLLDEAVDIRINRLATEHDAILIAGPVLPHEVVGFSGGTKYLFPGLSGAEMIDASHWLGALVGIGEIIGAPGATPVRALIDRAATLVPARQLCLALVTDGGGTHGAFMGPPGPAQAAAAELSARVHVTHLARPFHRILAIVPPMYEDLWTAAKGIYKLDPITADGGEIVLLAPHVKEFSTTHGRHIRRVGYHCRDYLLAHLDRLHDIPRGVLAHSAHVRGAGHYDTTAGERCRIGIALATAIPADACRAVNLGHHDPAGIDAAEWASDPHTLVVPRAGERLYRLASRSQLGGAAELTWPGKRGEPPPSAPPS